MLYCAAALYGVGNALRSAALVAYALDVLPPASRGVGIGLLRCAGDLGGGFCRCQCQCCLQRLLSSLNRRRPRGQWFGAS